MRKLTSKQKKIARLLQKDIPVTKFPFKKMSGAPTPGAKEILTALGQFREQGLIRKFGAILRHQKAGYGQNALVLWSVPASQTEATGRLFASFSFISHCYERHPAFLERYNLFTMLHSDGRSISSLIKDMVNATGIGDYLILKSLKEYKKTSPEYF